MSIYVEISIRGSTEELWEKTQQPEAHQRWDLRFSRIEYLPRLPGESQKFRYSTRIGAGLHIEGEGESTGEHDDASGQRISALKFWSKDRKSLIEWGSGYWKYLPQADGVCFLTSYDYRTRFGIAGRVFDVGFRPLMAWATAWSFDRLRLWIEDGVSPETSRACAIVYSLTRLTLASVVFYHGLIPKLMYRSPDELDMVRNLGVASFAAALTVVAGWLEIAFALLLLISWRSRWPLWITITGMIAATVSVAISSPAYFHQAFDPLTLNLSVAALAGCGLVVARYVPTATRCLWSGRGSGT